MSAGGIDPDHISELFSGFGPVAVRRMFGGAGLFADGVMFGIIDDGVIYLKADATTIPDFELGGAAPFSYPTKTGVHTLRSYWRLPDRLYDEPDELARWAQAALAVARIGARPKTRLPRSQAGGRKQRGCIRPSRLRRQRLPWTS